MPSNTHKVPAKQWRKWSDPARESFNTLYSLMMDNAEIFLHPKQEAPPPEHWKTTAWNASWEAADQVQGLALRVGDIVQSTNPPQLPDHVVK